MSQLGDRLARCRVVAEVAAPPSARTLDRRAPYLWEKVRTKYDNWVLAGAGHRLKRWIRRGVPCYWNELGPPKPFNMGVSCVGVKGEEEEWLRREEERCVESGAWRRVKWCKYISKAFVIPKAGLDAQGRKQFRLIVDLRPLNVHCREWQTRYETLSRLCSVIMDGEKVAFLSFDIKDAYHMLQIDDCTVQEDGTVGFQQYFGFNLGGKVYVCAALPFGWNASPYVFNTAMKTLTGLLRAEGLPSAAEMADQLRKEERQVARGSRALRVGHRAAGVTELSRAEMQLTRVPWHVLPYCDDFLLTVKGDSPEQRLQNAHRACAHADQAIEFLGAAKHPTKGQWLEQGDGEEKLRTWVHHLGLKVDSESGRFSAPVAKLLRVIQMARALRGEAGRNRRLVRARQIAGFNGLVQSLSLAVLPAELFQRALQDDLKTKANWSSRVRLSRQSLRDLTFWIELPTEWNGAPISKSTVTRLLYSDASEFAVGGLLAEQAVKMPEQPGLNVQGPRWHRALTVLEQEQGIFIGEIRALVETIEKFAPELAGHTVRFMEDNQAAMYATRRLTSKHPDALPLLRRLWALLSAHRIRLQHVDYVRSEHNPADQPSRWRFFDEWQLQPAVFRWVNHQFPACTLDLFASENTHQLPRYVSRFHDPKAVAVDAWSQRWSGERGWINADWDLLERIAQRLEEEPAAAATVVCPYFPGQSYFQRLLALADRALVVPWDSRWGFRPQQRECGQIGPSNWSVCFVSVPARPLGSSAVVKAAPVPSPSVDQLLQWVELPNSIGSVEPAM